MASVYSSPRALASVGVFLLVTLLSACGGSDSNDGGGMNNPPPAGDGNDNAGDGGDDGNAGNDGNDADDGDDGNNGAADDAATADVSFTDTLAATESIVVTFSKAMDAESLQIGGTLVAEAHSEWTSGTTMRLTPGSWWPTGAQTLTIDALDTEGSAMDTLEVNVEVAPPFVRSQAAEIVIGQQDFSNGYARQDENAATADANTLDRPGTAVAWSEEDQLMFISDTGDSRVLAFDGVPQVNNANASFVLGQPDFTASVGGTTQSKYRTPMGISANGGHLIVGDQNSNRLLIYNGVPQNGPGMADVVIGQENFEDHDDSCAPNHMNHVHGHFVTPAGRLLVTDSQNNRVLIWNAIPQENGAAPDLVLGQASASSCIPNDANHNGFAEEGELPGARTLQHPTSVWSDDERLVVVDNYNNRVLIWNSFPEENAAPADIVLGQGDMSMVAPNDDDQDGVPDADASARVLNYPWSVWVEGEHLFIADESNHRVLVWNSWPEASFKAADIVLGQQDFAARQADAGGATPSANTLDTPKGVRVIGRQLLVTDTGNSRVLIYNAE